jgi:hypothetical protein
LHLKNNKTKAAIANKLELNTKQSELYIYTRQTPNKANQGRRGSIKNNNQE